MTTISDRYEHRFHRYSAEQYDNLLMLARYLIVHSATIDAAGGLLFDPVYMLDFMPFPDSIADRPPVALPPLAYGPLAGIAAQPGEDWQAYCERAFGICITLPDPFCLWLQSPLWRKTEPSAKGAGLRIAYVLEYGIPDDHIEIAMGQAHTKYDQSGFLWDKLDLPAALQVKGLRDPIRTWPDWIGATRLNARRAAITLRPGNLRQTLVASGIARIDELAGLGDAEIAALEYEIGPMPESYRQVLSLIGRRAGRLDKGGTLRILADHLRALNRHGHSKRVELDAEDGDPVPDTALFIGAPCSTTLWFILPEPRSHHTRADSPVFAFDTETGKVSQVSISVWGWAERLIRNAESHHAVELRGGRHRPGLLMLAGALLAGIVLFLIYRLTV